MGPGRRGDQLTTYQPTGIAFDASGNLWVANGDYTVVEFGANQVGRRARPRRS